MENRAAWVSRERVPGAEGQLLPGLLRRRSDGGGEEVGRAYFKLVSKSLRMRLYSSAQLEASTNEWSSTGYGATDQFSLRSSMRRCVRRTVSWNSTLVSTMPWQMRSAPFKPPATKTSGWVNIAMRVRNPP